MLEEKEEKHPGFGKKEHNFYNHNFYVVTQSYSFFLHNSKDNDPTPSPPHTPHQGLTTELQKPQRSILRLSDRRGRIWKAVTPVATKNLVCVSARQIVISWFAI